MTTIIMRNAFFLKGRDIPRDVSHWIDGRPVTWAEVIEARRVKQRRILRNKRSTAEWRPVRITVWYNPSWIYMGWHAFIDGIGCQRKWIRNDRDEAMLLACFPLADNFQTWKPAFAEKYQRGTLHDKPRGSVFCWGLVSGGHIQELRLEAPLKNRINHKSICCQQQEKEKEKRPMDIRVQAAYHFKIDPAKLTPGRIQLPEQITRTVLVGEEMTTEKVSVLTLSAADRATIIAELEKQTREATRTARPAGSPEVSELPAEEPGEGISAF